MRLSLLSLTFLLTACATQSTLSPVMLSGRLTYQAHATPQGDKHQAPVIELAQPFTFGGERFNTVQLILDEPYFVQWGSLVGRLATVTCSSPELGTLWAHKYLHCQPANITVEP